MIAPNKRKEIVLSLHMQSQGYFYFLNSKESIRHLLAQYDWLVGLMASSCAFSRSRQQILVLLNDLC